MLSKVIPEMNIRNSAGRNDCQEEHKADVCIHKTDQNLAQALLAKFQGKYLEQAKENNYRQQRYCYLLDICRKLYSKYFPQFNCIANLNIVHDFSGTLSRLEDKAKTQHRHDRPYGAEGNQTEAVVRGGAVVSDR